MSDTKPLKFPDLPVTTQKPNLADGGGPPHDGDMLERLARLEAILPSLASKADIGDLRADLHKSDSATKGWMIATVISLFLGFAGLFFAMNSASKAPIPAPAPTIIQVPAYIQQAPASAQAAQPTVGAPRSSR